MRFLLIGTRSFEEAPSRAFDNGPETGQIGPVVNNNQIVMAALDALQQSLQEVTLLENTDH
jgi:hypothetical protein